MLSLLLILSKSVSQPTIEKATNLEFLHYLEARNYLYLEAVRASNRPFQFRLDF